MFSIAIKISRMLESGYKKLHILLYHGNGSDGLIEWHGVFGCHRWNNLLVMGLIQNGLLQFDVICIVTLYDSIAA
jgi:hypothetical protein